MVRCELAETKKIATAAVSASPSDDRAKHDDAEEY